LNWEKGKSQYAQCEIKLRDEKQKLNITEKVKREECTHTKEHERNRERTDRKRQQVKPSMNRTEE
jgi:hypothetical protein